MTNEYKFTYLDIGAYESRKTFLNLYSFIIT